MRKSTLLLFFLFVFLSSQAQITINASTFNPVIGTTCVLNYVGSHALNLNAGGANATWDLSSLIPSQTLTQNYISLGSSSSPSFFSTANIVEQNPSATPTETYYYISNSEYSAIGQYVPGSARLIYNDKRELVKFPMTYNTTCSETFAATVEALAYGYTLDRAGSIKIQGDAYGSLILPYATVNNVLRVCITSDYDDEMSGMTIATYSDTIYLWCDLYNKTAIASQTILYVNYSLQMNQITYMTQASLVVADDHQIKKDGNLTLFPNPAKNVVNVKNTEGIASIDIYDLKGLLIKTVDIEADNQQINISNLSAGVYFVKYNTSDGSYTEKLIVK